ncbi:MAG: HlyD family efflux transporter periplasmic adaptor subunit [Lachnospiraceae bacterium]|nr:HlyD family efflux transporter periplasmic adaptor subunit [Lachnospiraceae bacterium]
MKKKNKIAKIIIPLSIVLVLAIALIFILRKPKELTAVKTERGTITGTVRETGSVCGLDEEVFYAGVSAPVENFDLKEGDRVKAGGLLLSYDLSDLEHASRQASLAREQSEAQLDGALKKSDENKKRYENAKNMDAAYAATYALVRQERQDLLDRQYADDRNAQCTLDGINKRIAQKNEEILDKTQELTKAQNKASDYVAKEEEVPKKVRDKKKKLQNELNDLNDELADLQTEAASIYSAGMSAEENTEANEDANMMEDLNRRWQETITEKQTYEASFLNEDEKESLAKQAESAAENESEARRELAKGESGVKADHDGVVKRCSIKKGAYVPEGTELFAIEPTDEIRVKVSISRFDIANLEEGQEALVEIPGASYKGHVTNISSLAVNDSSDKSRIDVWITIDEPDDKLIIGVDADVTVFTKKAEGSVLIPVNAYYSDDGGSYCYVLANGVIEKRYFEAGIVNDEYTEALSGINEGEILITDAVTDSMIGERAAAGL